MLRGLAALLGRSRHHIDNADIDDDGGPPPSPLAVAQPVVDDPGKNQSERHPVDDDGNYHAWPNDPDEVPGWVIQAEQWRAAAGITDRLPARTLREFREQLEMCTVVVDSDIVAPVAPLPALSPRDAARAFLDDLFAESKELGEKLELGVQELKEKYEVHCARENRVACAIEQMKNKLSRMPGCRRTQLLTQRDGRRHRPTVWIIDPEQAALAESVTDVIQFRMAA